MDFSKVTEYVNSVVDEIGVPSVDMIVCRDHEQLYRYMAGHRDTEEKSGCRAMKLIICIPPPR